MVGKKKSKSVYENLSYGLNIHNFPKNEIPDLVEKAMRESYLWEEVKDELKKPAVKLSGGQQRVYASPEQLYCARK